MTVVDLTVDAIAAGGDGVARTGELVVFIPRAAPDDRARVRLETKKRFAKGTIEALIAPSPQRVEPPPCSHYVVDKCGGCQIQHLEYSAQLEAKGGIVRDALTRIGKRHVERPDVEASPKQWRYRTKLTLAMKRRRGGDWVIGLHPYDDPGRVFHLTDCPITDERVMAIWREVIAARSYFPPVDELRASVQLAAAGAAIVMEGGDTWPNRGVFFGAVPSATSLWWQPPHRARALVAERGAGSPASFAQINADVGARLHEYVISRARAHDPRVVVDGYAGSGATSIPLAQDGRRVVAIEADRDAADRCAAQLPEGSSVIAARVEDAIERALPADVVLINPPRTGIHERVAQLLQSAEPAPRAVIYVSCDPATLARDLVRMPRYRIASLRSFDMFPQTAHVETVCELVPGGGVKYFVRIDGEDHDVVLDGDGVHVDGDDVVARIDEGDGTPIRMVTIGDEVHRVVVRRGATRGVYVLWLDGHRFEVEALDERTRAIQALSGAAAGPTGPAPLKAPMPGLIVRVNVQVGDTVQAGQGMVVMEAMKMENELRAQAAGKVKNILASPGMAVDKGALLIELE